MGKMPENLKNKTKAEIIFLLGPPEYTLIANKREFWQYNNKGGWFIYLPMTNFFGITRSEDLILEFKQKLVVNCYMRDEGFAFGLDNLTGAVSN